METRYPVSIREDINIKDTKEAKKIATKIRELVLEKI